MKKQEKIKSISAKELNKRLTTIAREDKKAFKTLMMMAQEQGIKLKSGSFDTKKWISESKSKQSLVERFYKQMVEKYGTSYSAREKKLKEEYKKYVQDVVDESGTPLKYKSWKTQFKDEFKKLAEQMFNLAYQLDLIEGTSKTHERVDEAQTVYDYSLEISSGNEEKALDMLTDKINYFDSQIRKYGINPDYKPIF